jgi:hypothetical protein
MTWDPERPAPRLVVLVNEIDLQSQLSFSRKRTRRTPKAATQAGFYMTNHSELYIEVKHTNFRTLNQNLFIDLGTEYNEELNSTAEDGFTIFMVRSKSAEH